MSKKFGLFGDNDLFFAKKLKPLADRTKMRKFQTSAILITTVLGISLYIPYWIYINHFCHQIEIKYDIKYTEKEQPI